MAVSDATVTPGVKQPRQNNNAPGSPSLNFTQEFARLQSSTPKSAVRQRARASAGEDSDSGSSSTTHLGDYSTRLPLTRLSLDHFNQKRVFTAEGPATGASRRLSGDLKGKGKAKTPSIGSSTLVDETVDHRKHRPQLLPVTEEKSMVELSEELPARPRPVLANLQTSQSPSERIHTAFNRILRNSQSPRQMTAPNINKETMLARHRKAAKLTATPANTPNKKEYWADEESERRESERETSSNSSDDEFNTVENHDRIEDRQDDDFQTPHKPINRFSQHQTPATPHVPGFLPTFTPAATPACVREEERRHIQAQSPVTPYINGGYKHTPGQKPRRLSVSEVLYDDQRRHRSLLEADLSDAEDDIHEGGFAGKTPSRVRFAEAFDAEPPQEDQKLSTGRAATETKRIPSIKQLFSEEKAVTKRPITTKLPIRIHEASESEDNKPDERLRQKLLARRTSKDRLDQAGIRKEFQDSQARRSIHADLLEQIEGAEQLDRDLKVQVNDVRRTIENMGARVGASVSLPPTSRSRNKTLWITSALAAEFLLAVLLFRIAMIKTRFEFSTAYYDPFYPFATSLTGLPFDRELTMETLSVFSPMTFTQRQPNLWLDGLFTLYSSWDLDRWAMHAFVLTDASWIVPT